MDKSVKVLSFQPPKIDYTEILRYAGVKGKASEIESLITEVVKEGQDKLRYGVCYLEVPLTINGDQVDFSFATVNSKTLSKTLEGCERAILFAGTIGVEIDRLIIKHSTLSQTKALLFQAFGAERIESLINQFNLDLKEEYQLKGKFLTSRFSPGYGDFSLEFQKEIFNLLNCSKHIGLTLNDSLIMSPSKSVTGVIGVSNNTKNCKESCSNCDKTDCDYRRK